MSNKLSFSAISTYTTCGHKYYLRYKKKYKGKYFHAALAYGSAIDAALNELLLTKDVQKSIEVFEKTWNFQKVNKNVVALAKYTEMVYAESDFDEELLQKEDVQKLDELLLEWNVSGTYLEIYNNLLEEKKKIGWDNLIQAKKEYFNYCNWLSMRRKGHIMIDSYNRKVIPRINKVLAVQKENYLENSNGDRVVQYLDLIVEWEDGRNLLGDNKTSAKAYDEDSASRSPQLISYFHGAKEEYKLDAVGFFVLNKQIVKNRVKTCTKCGHSAKTRATTCDNEIDGVRCKGAWTETINPECNIQIVINNVTSTAEQLVMSTFDEANDGITKGNFYKNLGACKSGPIICEFFGLCWHNDMKEIVTNE
jgi:hypothetical protein